MDTIETSKSNNCNSNRNKHDNNDSPNYTLNSKLKGHSKGICDFVWSNDNHYLCSCSDDNLIIIWDVCKAKPIKTLPSKQIRMPQSNSNTNDSKLVSFNPNQTINAKLNERNRYNRINNIYIQQNKRRRTRSTSRSPDRLVSSSSTGSSSSSGSHSNASTKGTNRSHLHKIDGNLAFRAYNYNEHPLLPRILKYQNALRQPYWNHLYAVSLAQKSSTTSTVTSSSSASSHGTNSASPSVSTSSNTPSSSASSSSNSNSSSSSTSSSSSSVLLTQTANININNNKNNNSNNNNNNNSSNMSNNPKKLSSGINSRIAATNKQSNVSNSSKTTTTNYSSKSNQFTHLKPPKAQSFSSRKFGNNSNNNNNNINNNKNSVLQKMHRSNSGSRSNATVMNTSINIAGGGSKVNQFGRNKVGKSFGMHNNSNSFINISNNGNSLNGNNRMTLIPNVDSESIGNYSDATYDAYLHEWQKIQTHESYIFCLAWNSQSSVIASGSYDHTVRLWDARIGHCLSMISAHTKPVISLDFSYDGTVLLSGAYDGLVRGWDMSMRFNTFHCIKTIGYENIALSFAKFTPNAKYVLCGQRNSVIKLWDFETSKPVKIYKGLDSNSNEKNINGAFAMKMEEKKKESMSLNNTNNKNNNNTNNNNKSNSVSIGENSKASGHLYKNIKYCLFNDFLDNYIVTGSEDGRLYAFDIESKECIHLTRNIEQKELHKGAVIAANVKPLQSVENGYKENKNVVVSGSLAPEPKIKVWTVNNVD